MLLIRRIVLILLSIQCLLLSSIQDIHAANAITIGTIEILSSIDPAQSSDVFSWAVLTHIYTGLTRQIPGSLRYELALATSHIVSADGLLHTFTIRPNAMFNDGNSITAQTFADSINHALIGNTAVKPYVKSASVNSDGALELTLNAPLPYIEQLLALPPYFPTHPSGKPITNGVYKITSFEPGKSIVLEHDPAWNGAPAATATITIRHYDTPAELRRALTIHEIDLAWRGLPPDEIDIAKRTAGIREVSASGLQTFYLLIKQTKPFDKLAARQAMTYLIDRDYLAGTSLQGTGQPLYSLIPPELLADQTAHFPTANTPQAKMILKNGGFSKFKTIDADLQTSTQIYGDLSRRGVDQIAAYLRQSEAYQVAVRDTEPPAFYDQIERGTFSLSLLAWTPLVPHPDAYLRPLLYSQGQLAVSAAYANSIVDKLLDQASLTDDPALRQALYQQVLDLGVRDIIAIPLWQDQQHLLAWDSISDITLEPNYILWLNTLTIH